MRFFVILILWHCFVAPSLALADPGTDVVVTTAHTKDHDRAVSCLATAIAYEAGHEPIAGQQAVAEVILNRLRHPSFPKTVCGVIFAGSERRTGCQFSFACDGSLNRRMSDAVIATTRAVAMAALDGALPRRVAGATHYHADYVSPYWAPSLIRIVKIGAHIFYRGAGTNDIHPGIPYLPGAEPTIAQLKTNGSLVGNSAVSLTRPLQPAAVFAPWGLAPPIAAKNSN